METSQYVTPQASKLEEYNFNPSAQVYSNMTATKQTHQVHHQNVKTDMTATK